MQFNSWIFLEKLIISKKLRMSQQNDEVKDMSDEEVKEEIQEDDMSTNRIVAEMIRGLSI